MSKVQENAEKINVALTQALAQRAATDDQISELRSISKGFDLALNSVEFDAANEETESED